MGMGLFRFCRAPVRAFALIVGRFPTFIRLSWVCVAVSLVSGAVSERHLMAGNVVDLLARGVFAVAWLRLVGLGEMPGKPAYFRLGRREIFTALGWMMAELFVVMPAQVMAASIAMATGTSLTDVMMVTLGLSHLLLGAAFLLPTEAALENTTAGVTWRLPDLVIKGGLAVSIAAFLAWLPINLITAGLRELPDIAVIEGLTLPQLALTLTRYLGIAVTAGTMALIWNSLTRDGE
jgi:hypothetical protein